MSSCCVGEHIRCENTCSLKVKLDFCIAFWWMLKTIFVFLSLARQPPVKPSGIPTGSRGKRYVTASSTWNRYHAPWRARLHQRVTGRYRGGWSARKNNRRQYIQFDLRRPYRVVKVVTQGRYDAKQWVTSFIISYSQDKYRWIRYKQYGRVKVSRVFFMYVCLAQRILKQLSKFSRADWLVAIVYKW